ncbi:hypothetical protein VJY32_00105 [Ignavibacteria bacterium 4148-Me]
MGTIKANFIIEKYEKLFEIDVNKYFDVNEIYKYRCNNCSLKYYHPLNLIGDSEFYSKLAKFDWYYMKDKYEFNEVLKFI